MRGIPDDAVRFVARHEGLRLESYLDAAGVQTVGYGHTGPAVHAGMRITQAQAEAYLADDLRIAASRLHGVVKREVIDDLTPNQYSALLSFVFNLGAKPDWTIWKRLNARQFDQVPAEIQRFVYVSTPKGKVKIRGLVNRRAAEVVLWSAGEPGSINEDPPSSVTREAVTPPAVSNPVALAKEPAFILSVAGLFIGAPGLITKVIEALTPLTPQYPAAAEAVEFLAHVSPVAAAVATLVLYLQKKQASR